MVGMQWFAGDLECHFGLNVTCWTVGDVDADGLLQISKFLVVCCDATDLMCASGFRWLSGSLVLAG